MAENLILEWQGQTIDFGGMSEAEAQDWIDAQSAGEVLPEAGSAIDPTHKTAPATVPLRYGLPLATAGLTKSIPLTSAAAGAGEIAARTIEGKPDEADDPKEFAIQQLENVLAGGAAAGLEALGLKYLAPTLTKGMNWAHLQGSKLYRRFLLPDKMPPNVETALRVLKALSGEGEGLFAPSLGQMARHEGKLVAKAEDIARSSLFSGKTWAKFDSRNLDVVQGETEKLFRSMVTELDDDAFGRMMQNLLTGPEGENIFIRGIQNTMYDEVRNIARSQNIRPDMTNVFDYLNRHKNLDEVKNVVSRIDDILLDSGVDLPSSGKWKGWNNMPASLAIEIRREVNAYANKLSDKAQKRLITQQILPRIRESIDTAFGANDEALYLLKKADDLVGTTSARKLGATVKTTVMGKLAADPGAMMRFFKAGGSRLDRLNALEKLFTQTHVEGVGKVTKLGRDVLENKVYPALRHSILAEAINEETNTFVGRDLVKLFSRKGYGKDGGAFLNKIFSKNGKSYVEALRAFATTLAEVEKAGVTTGSAIWLKLMQGGAMMQGVGLAASGALIGGGKVVDSDTMVQVGGTGAIIFISPSLLSRKLTDVRFIRMLTDGIAHGPKSRPFARMVSTLTKLNREARKDWVKMNPEEKEFYSSTTGKNLQRAVKPEFQPF